jgi:hypothetical protein
MLLLMAVLTFTCSSDSSDLSGFIEYDEYESDDGDFHERSNPSDNCSTGGGEEEASEESSDGSVGSGSEVSFTEPLESNSREPLIYDR